ncbi:catechol 2,3-dioxygenase-like lactoylglutathione lyase family enzyme [Sphingomonas jinjuensis]|uniref:Catechol 2,3-dioxygenase-like lactoylglutathione lyase family enzyme n=1 Tax=Sphingomonas jinjuensis TaxID=535907 RepID=A0A840FHE3_9SPHN|nr:VOC family protein [Sphingomonas jinjuensis]MBB4153398.1 catechol 2,3-dioxygenase-like lactoylglutathione lyase family enzyme [Sphingomonas jinjuensis]
MINHVMVGTNDIDRAKAFYDKVLAVVGAGEPFRNVTEGGKTRLFYSHGGGTLAVSEPLDGEAATCANGFTLGFKCASAEQVKQFHDVAVEAGGTSIEDAPGLRSGAMGPMHLAYVRDPDGHKLCAIYRGA